MTREASVELLGWDKGPLCRSRSHRISWMGLQLCRTNIYTVSCYWNILTSQDKNRQGDWKVRYTCTTFLFYLRIYYWIIHWSKLRKYNNERGSIHLRVFIFWDAARSLILDCHAFWKYFTDWNIIHISIKYVKIAEVGKSSSAVYFISYCINTLWYSTNIA